MELQKKLNNLLNKREEIDDEIREIQLKIKSKESTKCFDLKNKYIYVKRDSVFTKMYVRKVSSWNDDTCHLLGPAISLYRHGNYIFSSHHQIITDFDLTGIEEISESEWLDWCTKIKEMFDKPENIK
jgi:hypothetical protein